MVDVVAGARLSLLSLVEGPRTLVEESPSEPRDSLEDGERANFFLWRVIWRRGGLEESSEDVGLIEGLVVVEKLRYGKMTLEMSGLLK